MSNPLERLRHHVSGAIERGEAQSIVAVEAALTQADRASWLRAIWGGLESHRENCIPEGEPAYDAEWDDICTAMAWVAESLGLEPAALL